jgi:HlyD family secretion protein
MRHKLSIAIVAVMALGVSVAAYYRMNGTAADPQVNTAAVTRGDIRPNVQATGTLQAVSTVEVGSQVSGRISELHADFNWVVRKGQVVARLDPSLFQAEVEQARATLVRLEAEENRARVQQQDAATKLTRAKDLAAANLIARQDLDTAQSTYDAAVAAVKSAHANVVQAGAALNQAQVNLQHTVIEAPTDGVVISRNVEVGQTVAATMQAPTLFIIAGDLSKMQVNASVDEADIGAIRPGQAVRFTVDAYPDRRFRGSVTQVRLQPTVVQNVTTYTTVIDVPNDELLLKPGMTATVTVDTAQRDNVLTVPNAALRFRPTGETFAALGQEMPEAAIHQRGSGASAASGAGRVHTAANATAEKSSDIANWRDAKTIDAAFGPVPAPDAPARVWQYRDGRLVPVTIRTGLSDGTMTEVISGPLEDGSTVVTGIAVPGTTMTSASSQSRSPLLPQFPRRQRTGRGGGG